MSGEATRGAPDELNAQLVPELCVLDLDRSLAFYVEAGFALVRRTATFASLQLEERFLFLTVTPGAKVGPTPPNFRIMVDNVDAVFDRMVELGVPVKEPPRAQPYGLRDFTVRDPTGYEVRFAQVTCHGDA